MKLERRRLALTTGREKGLFDRKAHRNEWVKTSGSHLLHDNGEGTFYFEGGLRAFAVLDDAGYPMNFISY